MPWYFSPHTGGKKIPPTEHAKIQHRVDAYAATRPWSKSHKLQLRFRGQFCYVDEIEKDGTTSPLGRLRYFHLSNWSLDFYTYSNEKYTPCTLLTGKETGSLEECIAACELYLL